MSLCPTCGSIATRHGIRTRRLRDVAADCRPIEEDVSVQRWRCSRCKGCFDELPPGARRGSLATIALRDAVANACFREGYAAAGQGFGIDEKTARTMFREWAASRESELPSEPPDYIGLHLATIGGVETTIITDVGATTLIDIIPGASLTGVGEWLHRTGGLGRISRAAIAIHAPFREALSGKMPWVRLSVIPAQARRQGLRWFLAAFRHCCRYLGRIPGRNIKESPRIFATPRGELSPKAAEDMSAWDATVLHLYAAKERFMMALASRRFDEARRLLDEARVMCAGHLSARLPAAFLGEWTAEMAEGAADPELDGFGETLGQLAHLWSRRRPSLPFEVSRGFVILRDGGQALLPSGLPGIRCSIGVPLDKAIERLSA